MKFFYNDKLVRTSKTHHYTHAVIRIDTGKALTCSATRQGCESFINSYISEAVQGIENAKRALNALTAGRSKYEIKFGRKSYFETVKHDPAYYQEWIDGNNKRIEWIRTNWKIVELEERT